MKELSTQLKEKPLASVSQSSSQNLSYHNNIEYLQDMEFLVSLFIERLSLKSKFENFFSKNGSSNGDGEKDKNERMNQFLEIEEKIQTLKTTIQEKGKKARIAKVEIKLEELAEL